MASKSTPMRFQVTLSQVDRGVYETIEIKLAKHPSETDRYLLCRLFAFCVLYDEGLAFAKGGLSSVDEPALAQRSLDGRLLLHVEIGTPTAERLHKASKASPRVVVFTQHDPALLVASVSGQKVHRLESIEAYVLAPSFLDAVAVLVGERGAELDVTVADGQLYVNVAGQSLGTEIRRIELT